MLVNENFEENYEDFLDLYQPTKPDHWDDCHWDDCP